jgi:spore maturation protein SpmA
MAQPSKSSAINTIFVTLMLGGIFVALFNGSMESLTKASFDAAKTAVTLAISLVGAMALWLGLMKVAENAGLLSVIARKLKPVMTRLFPEVPGDHPAMSAMIMNMASNILGLGNAATPFGIKAMQALESLNKHKGTATHAMCLFLAINTSSVTLLPLGAIAVRAGAGADDPAGILLPSILATACSTLVAVMLAKLFARRDPYPPVAHSGGVSPSSAELDLDQPEYQIVPEIQAEGWRRFMLPVYLLVFLGAAVFQFVAHAQSGAAPLAFFIDVLPTWLIPFLMGVLVTYGLSRQVAVYESVCDGAKEGFDVALRIIPFLVAILVAIALFRSSGALDMLINILAPLTNLIGMPADTLPMALVRPLSGSGAFAVMSDIVNQDPNSLSAFIASVMQGSTETTFYVLAVYFGAVGIVRTRYVIVVALLADLTGVLAAVFWGSLFFTG